MPTVARRSTSRQLAQLDPARCHEDVEIALKAQLSGSIIEVVGLAADRVRRLRHPGAELVRGPVGRGPGHDGAAALLQPRLTCGPRRISPGTTSNNRRAANRRAGPRDRYDGGVNSIALVTVLSAFLASAVEFVEAVTIVLAVGVTRQWRSTLIGVAAAVVSLAVLIASSAPRSGLLRADRGAAPDRRRLPRDLRAAVADQGHPARRRRSGEARRGRDLRQGRSPPWARGRRAGDGHRLDQLHRRVQGRPPRGPRGGLHRGQLRGHGQPPRAGRSWAPAWPACSSW